MKIEVGMKWGRVRVIGSDVDFKVYEHGPGVRERRRLTKYVCACDCGNEFVIWEDDWKGKRRTQDCGCGLAAQDGMIVTLTVSMRMRYAMWLRNKANELGGSRSSVVVGLIQNRMEEENAESKDGSEKECGES